MAVGISQGGAFHDVFTPPTGGARESPAFRQRSPIRSTTHWRHTTVKMPFLILTPQGWADWDWNPALANARML